MWKFFNFRYILAGKSSEPVQLVNNYTRDELNPSPSPSPSPSPPLQRVVLHVKNVSSTQILPESIASHVRRRNSVSNQEFNNSYNSHNNHHDSVAIQVKSNEIHHHNKSNSISSQRKVKPVPPIPYSTRPVPPPLPSKETRAAAAAAAAHRDAHVAKNAGDSSHVQGSRRRLSVFRSSIPRLPTIPDSHTRIGELATNQALFSGFAGILFGLLGLLSYFYQSFSFIFSNSAYEFVIATYCIGLSLFVILWENELGSGRKYRRARIPYRGIIYFVVSGALYINYCTLIVGVYYTITALTNCYSFYLREHYSLPYTPTKRCISMRIIFSFLINSCNNVLRYFRQAKQQNRIGEKAFFFLYLVANALLWWKIYNSWATAAFLANYSVWLPLAKAFASTCYLNSAVILLPICRNLIRLLYNHSTADQRLRTRLLRWFLGLFPIDSHISFHRKIALLILIGSIGHVAAHLINTSVNYANGLLPENSLYSWAYISGFILCLLCFFIYSASTINIRRAQFELFQIFHSCYIAYLIILFFHGWGGINPHFYYYITIPGLFYAVERVTRYYKYRLKAILLSVRFLDNDNIIELEFSRASGVFKQPFYEGQYVFLRCPHISQYEAHPFTVSSAPHELTTKLNIRVIRAEKSWTQRLYQYLRLFVPQPNNFLQFSALDRLNQRVAGKIYGPDDKRLFEIDGYYSAPTQHCAEYSVLCCIGSGIGATPLSSVLKSIVNHKWRYAVGSVWPQAMHCIWICSYRDIEAHRWLIEIITDLTKQFIHMTKTHANNLITNRTLQIHIYVTSTPMNQPNEEKHVNMQQIITERPSEIEQSKVFYLDEAEIVDVEEKNAENLKQESEEATWNSQTLYDLMKSGPMTADKSNPTSLSGIINVFRGFRPDFNSELASLDEIYPNDTVGVTFCGNPGIWQQLKLAAYNINCNRVNQYFELYKENF
jgi:hypothetical protein